MPRHIPVASALISGLAIASAANAGELPRPKSWVRIADAPYATFGAALAYDRARDRAVLYGGSGDPVGGTWEFDGQTWSNVQAFAGGSRVNHEMAYDSVRHQVILFGTATNISPETRAFDGMSWQVIASVGPGPRARFSMCEDTARRRVVLFGGQAVTGSIDNSTWEWNGAAWATATTSGPSLRFNTAMTFDSLRQRVVLFGGENVATTFDDTWEWDGATWIRAIAGATPPQRRAPALAFSENRRRALLHGGIVPGGSPTSQTWSWDGLQWRAEISHGPVATSAEMIYDSARSRLLMITVDESNDAGVWALPDCPGDANADGAVNMTDLTAVLSNYGQAIPIGVPGDVDGDGRVGFADLNQVLSYFGATGC